MKPRLKTKSWRHLFDINRMNNTAKGSPSWGPFSVYLSYFNTYPFRLFIGTRALPTTRALVRMGMEGKSRGPNALYDTPEHCIYF